jgi:hypothetical protein
MRVRRFLVALMLFASSNFAARADIFTVNWPNNTLTFDLSMSDGLINTDEHGLDELFFFNVDMTLNGVEGVAQFLVFFDPDAPSVLLFDGVPPIFDEAYFDSDDALWGGPVDDPSFALGTHHGFFSLGDPDSTATLVIAQDTSTVA